MQMARAEGASLRTDTSCDLALVVRMVADELSHSQSTGQLVLDLPQLPLMSNVDADVFAILVRNLLENALRHGARDAPVTVTLRPGAILRVVNDGTVVPPEVLRDLTRRFDRGNTSAEGSGFGLAIVQTIATGIGGTLEILSPAVGHADGFEVILRFKGT
jgi:two-component system OmpR family sensor kinase